MAYILIILIAFAHIYVMILLGYKSKIKNKKTFKKVMPKIMYSSLLASFLSALFWSYSPLLFTFYKVLIIKLIVLFLPAYYFVGAVSVIIGTLVKKLTGK